VEFSIEPKRIIDEMDSLQPPFRLQEDWYRWNVSRLQEKLLEHGVKGILLNNIWNIIYFSGLFHTNTERPFWLFIPAEGKPVFFIPLLDRSLVETWWIEDYEWYFDFPHHGPYNERTFEAGSPADLYEWLLSRLSERGIDCGVIGFDQNPGDEILHKVRTHLPGVGVKIVEDLCLSLRMIKTPDEIGLIEKAVHFQDHLLEYGRALLLKYGAKVTDFDIRHEMERYGTHLLMTWMNLDGKPHQGVGIDMWVSCRAGATTAYPHPNQFYYHRIQKGDAIQLVGFVHIGGYVGEGYRALQTHPMSDLQKRVWEVHTRMTELQIELCIAGTPCNYIARRVLNLAKDAGMEEFLYHRPAHGVGMEGHQPPCVSLGDETILQEGMVLSNEPGLYSPKHGWGYNHSNTILVGKEKGVLLNKVPMTKEWCWLDI
jgi:Xaa-Pro dipeptidase